MPPSLQKMNELLIYEAVFKNTSVGVLVVNSKGIIEFTNPYAASMLGYEEDELTGVCVEQLVQERYRTAHVAYRKSHQHRDVVHKMGGWKDLHAVTKKGDELAVEISINNCWLKGDIGNIVFMNDITEREKTELAKIRERRELEMTVIESQNTVDDINGKLERSRLKLGKIIAYQNALFDNAGVMIIITDPNGLIELLNPEAVKRIGYAEQEVVHKATPLLFHDEEELEQKRRVLFFDSGTILPGKLDVVVSDAQKNIHKETEYTYITKNGDRFPVSLTVAGIKNEADEITGYIYVAVDISERKTANEALCKALQKEKQLNQLQSKFISLASHEFRTPLCTILSSAFLLQDAIRELGIRDLDIYLWRIKSAATLVTAILDNFMQTDRLYESKTFVQPHRFNIIELLKALTNETSIASQRQISYMHTGTADVCIDAVLLTQIVKGLLSNAIKYSAANTVVEISTEADENKLKMIVRDQGIGILPEDHQNLMKPFFKGMNADNIPGVGLGLHLVLKYTEMMNGTIEYVSEPERGTVFIVRFDYKNG